MRSSPPLSDFPNGDFPNREFLDKLDRALLTIARNTRLLAAVTPENLAAERAALLREAEAGRFREPRWTYTKTRLPSPHDEAQWLRFLEASQDAVYEEFPLAWAKSYADRIEELALEVSMRMAVGQPKMMRSLAARRFGDGTELIEWQARELSTIALAQEIVSMPIETTSFDEKRWSAMEAKEIFEQIIAAQQLPLRVAIEARLSARAAAGDGVVYLGAGDFSTSDLRRLAAHEIFGHAISYLNSTEQNFALPRIGTAGGFADQEGISLLMEERVGALSPHRLRNLAARTIATQRMHGGASFADTFRALHLDLGFDAQDAIFATERAFRGGGFARDASYLVGYSRLKGPQYKELLPWLRCGRVSLSYLTLLGDELAHVLKPARFDADPRSLKNHSLFA